MSRKSENDALPDDQFIEMYRDLSLVKEMAAWQYYHFQDEALHKGTHVSDKKGNMRSLTHNEKNKVRMKRRRALKNLKLAIEDFDDDLFYDFNKAHRGKNNEYPNPNWQHFLETAEKLFEESSGTRGRLENESRDRAAACFLNHKDILGEKITASRNFSKDTHHPRYESGYVYNKTTVDLRGFLNELDPGIKVSLSQVGSLIRKYLKSKQTAEIKPV